MPVAPTRDFLSYISRYHHNHCSFSHITRCCHHHNQCLLLHMTCSHHNQSFLLNIACCLHTIIAYSYIWHDVTAIIEGMRRVQRRRVQHWPSSWPNSTPSRLIPFSRRSTRGSCTTPRLRCRRYSTPSRLADPPMMMMVLWLSVGTPSIVGQCRACPRARRNPRRPRWTRLQHSTCAASCRTIRT